MSCGWTYQARARRAYAKLYTLLGEPYALPGPAIMTMAEAFVGDPSIKRGDTLRMEDGREPVQIVEIVRK